MNCMTRVYVSHFWFLARSDSTKVEEKIVAAQMKSIMSNTISGPDPGSMVIFLTVSYRRF